MTKRTLGIIGARGFVGQELLPLVEAHGDFELHLLERVAPQKLDAYVLALPNGAAAEYVRAIDADGAEKSVIVDLSADHRFDDGWIYGQPERHRERIRGAKRIANPGCYATAMQLALAPLAPYLDGPAHVFGVSGYSGAGKKPSPKNDPELLRDNLLPYSLVDHVHEREVSRQLGVPVFFAPHVAPFFRGITVTISCALRENLDVMALYENAYGGEPGVHLTKEPPLVRDVRGSHDVFIGGVTTKDQRVTVVATIDNLLGGAASQALRNLNLALGLAERKGLDAAAH
jgi:N-acetyl-gamma-glutamyl-phosphate reductase common form